MNSQISSLDFKYHYFACFFSNFMKFTIFHLDFHKFNEDYNISSAVPFMSTKVLVFSSGLSIVLNEKLNISKRFQLLVRDIYISWRCKNEFATNSNMNISNWVFHNLKQTLVRLWQAWNSVFLWYSRSPSFFHISY